MKKHLAHLAAALAVTLLFGAAAALLPARKERTERTVKAEAKRRACLDEN